MPRAVCEEAAELEGLECLKERSGAEPLVQPSYSPWAAEQPLVWPSYYSPGRYPEPAHRDQDRERERAEHYQQEAPQARSARWPRVRRNGSEGK